MTPRNSRVNWQRSIQLLLLAAALALLWYQTRHVFVWVGFMFGESSEDMSHGWLVPLFSLYLLWRRRHALGKALNAPSLRGLLLACGWLFLLWLGERGSQLRITQVAVYGLLWSLPYAVFGRRMARLLFFPVLYLGFTVPLGFLDFFTVRLRHLSAILTATMLNTIGIPVVRVGTGLHGLSGNGFALDVADPCSGLRAIFAMTALTAGYAYLELRGRWRQWLLFACAIPFAILGNIVRVTVMALAAHLMGPKAIAITYHYYYGLVTFAIGALLMVRVAAWLTRIGTTPPGGNDLETALPDSAAAVAPGKVPGWLTLLLLVVAFATTLLSLRLMPTPYLEPQDFLTPQLNELPGYRLARPWFCQNDQCRRSFDDPEANADDEAPPVCPACGSPMATISLGEKMVLPADTLLLKGNYYDLFGQRYGVAVVINGAERRSIHRPELCLPAQGYSIDETRQAQLTLNGEFDLPLALVALRRIGATRGAQATGQAYFFISANRVTSSHLVRVLVSVRDRALFNRVTRWAMVVVIGEPAFNTPGRLLDLQEFMQLLYPSLLQRNPQPNTTPDQT